MRLKDKVSIITGGGSGMGRVASLMFAAEGAKVVVAEYNDDGRRGDGPARPRGRRRGDAS